MGVTSDSWWFDRTKAKAPWFGGLERDDHVESGDG